MLKFIKILSLFLFYNVCDTNIPQSAPQKTSEEKNEDKFSKKFQYRTKDSVKIQIIDKISDKVVIKNVAINETIAFNRIRIVVRKCFISPIDKPLNYTCYVEIYHIPYSKNIEKIFSNWMFTENITTNMLEHPVYDIKILK